MAISNVSAGIEVTATKTNEIISGINAQNGQIIYTTIGVTNFSWPVGVQTIEVLLCGGGGLDGSSYSSGPDTLPGLPGGLSPLCSKRISGVDAGTTIPVTVGDKASSHRASSVTHAYGGTSSFGTYLQSTGGDGSWQNVHGLPGTHTGDLLHVNELFSITSVLNTTGDCVGYGRNNQPGIVVVRW
jgi:hypothetical protein